MPLFMGDPSFGRTSGPEPLGCREAVEDGSRERIMCTGTWVRAIGGAG